MTKHTYSEIYIRPVTMSVVEDGEKVWMALVNQNGICEINKQNLHARIIKIFEDEPLTKKFLYCYVAKVKDYLVFSPGTAKKIAIYDLKDDCITYVPLKDFQFKCKENQNEIKFWNIIQYQSTVYLLGYSYPAIIKIDMNSFEIEYITDWVIDVEKYIHDGDICGYFADGYTIIDESAILPLGCMNAIIELNLNTSATKLKKLDIPMKGIGGLSSADKQNIWMVGKGSETNWIVCWNKKTENIKKIQLRDQDKNIFDPFYAPICTDSKIFFVPMSAHYIYELNVKTGKIKKNRVFESLFKVPNNSLLSEWKIMAPRLRNNNLFFFTLNNLMWYKYNISTEKFKSYSIGLDYNSQESYFYALYTEVSSQNIPISEANVPLIYFLNRISKNCESCHEEKMKNQIGEKIFFELYNH